MKELEVYDSVEDQDPYVFWASWIRIRIRIRKLFVGIPIRILPSTSKRMMSMYLQVQKG
jgi:hypothetical protein